METAPESSTETDIRHDSNDFTHRHLCVTSTVAEAFLALYHHKKHEKKQGTER